MARGGSHRDTLCAWDEPLSVIKRIGRSQSVSAKTAFLPSKANVRVLARVIGALRRPAQRRGSDQLVC